MDPPLFYLAPSGDARLLTLRISRSLFPNMAIAPEVTMTDSGAQSDERDIFSIDSDRTELGAADAATGVVCPLRVKSESESKRMRRPLAALRTMPSGLGYVYSRGAPAGMEPKTWLPKPPRGIGGSCSRHLLQDFGQRIVTKKGIRQFIL